MDFLNPVHFAISLAFAEAGESSCPPLPPALSESGRTRPRRWGGSTASFPMVRFKPCESGGNKGPPLARFSEDTGFRVARMREGKEAITLDGEGNEAE
jgi:hypothetical protein